VLEALRLAIGEAEARSSDFARALTDFLKHAQQAIKSDEWGRVASAADLVIPTLRRWRGSSYPGGGVEGGPQRFIPPFVD